MLPTNNDDPFAGLTYAELERQHAALGNYMQVRAQVEELEATLAALEARMAARAGVIQKRAAALAGLEATAAFDLPAPVPHPPSAALRGAGRLAPAGRGSRPERGAQVPVSPPTAPVARPLQSPPMARVEPAFALAKPAPAPSPMVTTPVLPSPLRRPPEPAPVSESPAQLSFVTRYRPGVLLSGGGPLAPDRFTRAHDYVDSNRALGAGNRGLGECSVAQCDPERGVMLSDPTAPLRGVMLWLSDAGVGAESDTVLIAPALYEQEATRAKVATTSRPELAEAGRVVTLVAGGLWLQCHIEAAQADVRGVFTALTLRVEAGAGEPPSPGVQLPAPAAQRTPTAPPVSGLLILDPPAAFSGPHPPSTPLRGAGAQGVAQVEAPTQVGVGAQQVVENESKWA